MPCGIGPEADPVMFYFPSFPNTNLDQIQQHQNTSIVNEKQNTNVRKNKDNEIFTTEENSVVAAFQRMPG